MSFLRRALPSLAQPAFRRAHLAATAGGPPCLAASTTAAASGGALAKQARQFTINYSVPERSHHYSQVTDDDLAHFMSVVGESGVITDDGREKYNSDWTGKHVGATPAVLLPRTTEQVSAIMKHCHERCIAVVPQGGNTGVVGGSTPVYDELVLSLSKLDSIVEFDSTAGVLTVESGAILEVLDNKLREDGFMMPIDLGAKGSCQIGGNLATNAGGIRMLRYGSLHGSVLGVEAVLADGTVMDTTSTLRKDNTGYDLKQLFIGSEGTLGIITKLSILTPPAPAAKNVALLACNTFEDVQKAMVAARSQLGEVLSAFEFIDAPSMELVLGHGGVFPDGMGTAYKFYCVVETSGASEDHDSEKMMDYLTHAMEEEIAVDGVLAQSASEMDNIWNLREGITEAPSKTGYPVFKYDLSLKTDNFYQIAEEAQQKLAGTEALVVGFGHMGDGNIHLSVSAPHSPTLPSFSSATAHQHSLECRHGISPKLQQGD